MKICLNKIYIFFVLFFITSCGVKKNVVKELESININDIVSQIILIRLIPIGFMLRARLK